MYFITSRGTTSTHTHIHHICLFSVITHSLSSSLHTHAPLNILNGLSVLSKMAKQITKWAAASKSWRHFAPWQMRAYRNFKHSCKLHWLHPHYPFYNYIKWLFPSMYVPPLCIERPDVSIPRATRFTRIIHAYIITHRLPCTRVPPCIVPPEHRRKRVRRIYHRRN